MLSEEAIKIENTDNQSIHFLSFRRSKNKKLIFWVWTNIMGYKLIGQINRLWAVLLRKRRAPFKKSARFIFHDLLKDFMRHISPGEIVNDDPRVMLLKFQLIFLYVM